MKYELIDTGEGKKLEAFGAYRLVRPCAHALWKCSKKSEWKSADAIFSRDEKEGWTGSLPDSWKVEIEGLTLKVSATDFGHLGLFPEHQIAWKMLGELPLKNKKVLNLFAYSGAASLIAAKNGAKVCHLDASAKMVGWARENARINRLDSAPIRWITDDVRKFLKREIKRESKYDVILLDPPSFGRGAKKEVFKIEEEIGPLLQDCRKVLTKDPLCIFFSCHTAGFTPLVMQHLLSDATPKKNGKLESGEMYIPSETRALPLGCYACWSRK